MSNSLIRGGMDRMDDYVQDMETSRPNEKERMFFSCLNVP